MAVAPSWCRLDPGSGCLTLSIHVQPNAKVSEIAGVHGDALKIRVAAPAVDNKANAALLDFLHRFLQLPSSRITLRHGARGRRKVVDIAGAGSAILARITSAAAPVHRR
ncbi:MAG: DUF167 domain-containing protein [Burkholderiales bacterium]|nr:DUF167 domain-containing protein [Burkholderiales bacterium]